MNTIPEKTSIWAELLASLAGAMVTMTIQLLFLLRTSRPNEWTRSEWIAFVLAAITGAVIGWAYRLATGLRKVTTLAIERLESTTRMMDLQEEPLKMLTTARRHSESLGMLLSGSLKEKYRYISYVNENQYLNYLTAAISESRKYEGVQMEPVRWFSKDAGTKQYLATLRDHRMKDKIRIFVLDENLEEAMKEDLANDELMKFYWESTGEDVRSYWITLNTLKIYYSILSDIRDCAISDEELYIAYDAPKQTLNFDLIRPDSDRREIFRRLAEQENTNSDTPFHKIPDRHHRSVASMASIGQSK